MPYRTIRTEHKTPTGIKVAIRREWYDIPKRHTVARMLGNDSIAKAVANEPITYEYRGQLYEDTPASMIDRIDEALWAGNVAFKDRALALVQRAKQKAEAMRAENNNTLQEGNNTMKHNNFRSIFTELKAIYATNGAKEKAVFAEWKEAQSAWKHAKENTAAGSKERMLAESDYIRAEEKYKREHEALVSSIEGQVTDLRKVLEAAVANQYRVSPGKVDNATLELLRLGVLRDSDMVELVKEHEGNPTMLAVIKKYAEEKENSKEMHALSCQIADMLDDTKEINAFDNLCRYGNRTYEIAPAQKATYHDLFDDLFDKMFDDAIAGASDRAFDAVGATEQGEGADEGE